MIGQVEDDNVLYYLHGNVVFTKNSVIFNMRESNSMTHENSLDLSNLNKDSNYNVRGIVFLVNFENSNDVIPIGSNILPHRSNYFLGNDSTKWRTNIANYKSIIYPNIYDGIDLIYRIKDGFLKYDFVIYPNANPSEIYLTYEGVESLAINSDSSLLIKTAFGQLCDTKPFIYQELGGTKNEVNGMFKIINNRSIGFEIQQPYDKSRPLIIDPGIEMSTFIGGSEEEDGESIVLDTIGNVYMAGDTDSANFPTTPGAYDITYTDQIGYGDAYVVKLNSNLSTLLYSTFLGGNKLDADCSIAVDSIGNAYVTGHTASSNYPTTPGAFDTSFNGMDDIFVTKLNSSGSELLFSTFIGGEKYDRVHWGQAIALDSTDNIYITGETHSFNFPTTEGAYDTSIGSNTSYDVFIVKLNNNGSALIYSTFFGGVYYEGSNSLALDIMGNVYITGYTDAQDFPITTSAYDITPNGDNEIFVAKFNSKGSTLLYSTLLGGNEGDYGWDITVDSIGNAYVTGYTESSNFPTTAGAYNTSFNGDRDVFIAKFNCKGDTLLYSTFLGGNNGEIGCSIVVDSIGNAHVIGFTYSSNFPITADAYDTIINGSRDAFIVKMNGIGSTLLYSTFLGGTDSDGGVNMVLNSTWDAYICGGTSSSDFPTTPGAYDTSFNGGMFDIFVAKIIFNQSDYPPIIEALEPGGSQGQTFFQGDIITILWNASDNKTLPLNPINISYGNFEIGWTTIAINESNDGFYLWNTSSTPGGTYWICLSVYDSNGQTVFDLGNYSFVIIPTSKPPPPIPYIEVINIGLDIHLTWDDPESLYADHYVLYRTKNQTEFNFTAPWIDTSKNINPLESNINKTRCEWLDISVNNITNANYSKEYYYIIRSINKAGKISMTSRTVGKWTHEFQEGINTFSLPLEPLETTTVTNLTTEMGADYINWMDTQNHTWTQGDTNLSLGQSYEVNFSSSTVFTFIGMPGAMIQYDNTTSFGFNASLYNEEANNLTANVDEYGNVTLSWVQPLNIGNGDGFQILRSWKRDGFWNISGDDYEILATLPFNTLTYTDIGNATSGKQYYYMIMPVNLSTNEKGLGTYSIGIWTEEYLSGYDTFGIPLKQSFYETADWYCNNIPDTVGINYYNLSVQRWCWHSTRMSAGAFDPVLKMTEGYQISTSNSTKFTFIGV
jgi:hypothetical protein